MVLSEPVIGSDPWRHPVAILRCPKLAKQLVAWHCQTEQREAAMYPSGLFETLSKRFFEDTGARQTF